MPPECQSIYRGELIRMVTGITDSESARQTMPPKKSNITKTNVYLPNPILRELRLIAVDTPGRMSVNAVIVGILEQYLRDRKTTSGSIDTQLEHHYDLGKSSRPPEIPEEFRPWIARLIYILTEQNAHATAAIKSNLQAFTRLTELDGGKDVPPPDEPVEDAIERALDFANRAAKTAEKLDRGDCDVRPGRRRVRAGRDQVA